MNILITGGASGLGKSITTLLAENNENNIFFTYSSSDDSARDIESNFKNTQSIKCDFRNHEQVENLATKIQNLDLDVLINNAYFGNPIDNYFHKISADSFSSDFNNNILPTVLITQSAIKVFRKKKQGKIITVLTAFLNNKPPIGASIYVANKGYLHSLVKSWANENIKFNISSNSVSPSFMQTGINNNVDERIIDSMIENHPLKKLLTTKEVADVVNFLVNSTNHINGIDLILNAGENIK